MLKPSRELIEHLGDRVTSELVDWFNTMDSAQKGELREINEQNAQRVEARIDQRSAELRAGITQGEARLDAKIDRFGADLSARIDRLEATLSAKIDRVDGRIDKMAAELREVLERRLGEQSRWSYLTWAVQGAMILGLYFK
jgi:DNA anti-recombination protein RmuC